MNQIPFRTNYSIWEIASVCIFLALGFVDPFAGALQCNTSFWALFSSIFMDPGESPASTFLALYALLLAVPAALTGWVLQALVIVAWQSSRTALPHRGRGSKAFGTSAIKRSGT